MALRFLYEDNTTPSTNLTPATAAVAMFNLKRLLKAAGWTVPRSSDGTTYNSSGDQITTGASGANGMDNAKAWYVIQAPAGGRQFCCQRQTTTGANTSNQWRIKYSFSAAFTGGAPAATVTPSATDEQILQGGGSDAAPTFTQLWPTTDGGFRQEIFADGASPYGWMTMAFLNGGGAASLSTYFGMDPTTIPSGTDNDPYVIFCGFTSGTLGRPAGSNTGSAAVSNGAGVFGYYKKGLAGEAFVRFGGAFPCYFNSVGSQITLVSNAQGASTGAGTDPISTNDDSILLIYIRDGASTTPGLKGTSTFARWNMVPRATGDTMTLSTSKDRIVVSDMNWPWDGSTPTV